MTLQAGRTGVRKDQVDFLGRTKGGGSADTYTKTQIDTKLSAKQDANKIGGLEFRDNEGQAQYKTPTGEWTNFSSGGDAPLGWNVPAELLTQDGLTFNSNLTNIEGGYYIDSNNICYINVTFNLNKKNVSSSSFLIEGLPHPTSFLGGFIINESTYKQGISATILGDGQFRNDAIVGNIYNDYKFRAIGIYILN